MLVIDKLILVASACWFAGNHTSEMSVANWYIIPVEKPNKHWLIKKQINPLLWVAGIHKAALIAMAPDPITTVVFKPYREGKNMPNTYDTKHITVETVVERRKIESDTS